MQLAGVLKEVAKSGAVFACVLVAACSGKAVDTEKSSTNTAPASTSAVSEPAHALVTVPAGTTMPADFGERMVAVRQFPGALGVTILNAQPGPGPAGFQSLAVVDFRDEASLQQWMKTLADAGVQARQADILAHDASDSAAAASATSYYAVNHYEVLVTPAEYSDYTGKYIVPNMAHQKSTGALLAYTMYIERAAPGEHPKSVLVKQYGSPEEQARGEAAKEIYKKDVLMKQPEWKRINDTKTAIRNDLTETFAREAN